MGKLVVGLTRFLLLCAVLLVLPSLAASQPTQLTFTVDATSGWQNTGIELRANQTFSVEYVSGSWTVDYRSNFDYVGLEGYPEDIDSQIYQGCKYIADWPYALLIGKVGEDGRLLRLDREDVYVVEDGTLFLSIHDACLADNAGSVTVTVTVNGTAPQLILRQPAGTAPNLVVLVHGCCTDENDVKNGWDSFGRLIAGTIQTPGPWEIVVWDWSDDTPKHDYFEIATLFGALFGPQRGLEFAAVSFIADAFTAYNNAADKQSTRLKDAIVAAINQSSAGSYEYIHLIAHSAGAKLIHEASKKLIEDETLTKKPFIHLTFLDAFRPFFDDYGNLEDYPEYFSEHYVDVNNLLPTTNDYLPHAFNFDISNWEHSSEEEGFGGHQWPVNWYKKSVEATEPEFEGLNYGYNLSLEGGNNEFRQLRTEFLPDKSCTPSDEFPLCLREGLLDQ